MRFGLIGINVLIVLAVLAFVIGVPGQSNDTEAAASIAANPANDTNPLDTLSSSEIAATAAQLAGLPEQTAIVNQADSDQAQLNMIATGNEVISKPQVVTSNYVSNKDIKTYIAVSGDTLASVAAKFNLSENTIKWSNNLTGATLTPGQKLLIPPVNGLVYTVKQGDTAASLAAKYGASEAEVTAYNDAELSGIKVGEQIIIPGGSEPAPISVASYGNSYGSGGFSFGSAPIYGPNGYDYGWCTWYVASQIPVPSNWGNAGTWAYYAERSPGWQVSSVPSVGAIAQNSTWFGGVGHVGIVTAVRGSEIQLTDMADPIWGAVSTHWVSASQFPNYIVR